MRNQKDSQKELSVFTKQVKVVIVESDYDAKKYITKKVNLEYKEYHISEIGNIKQNTHQTGLFAAIQLVWNFLRAIIYN